MTRPAAAHEVRVRALLLAGLLPGLASAAPCDDLVARFGSRLVDVVCFESPDLTTNGPSTTPANNSLAGLPAFAFTPVTDRGVISPVPMVD